MKLRHLLHVAFLSTLVGCTLVSKMTEIVPLDTQVPRISPTSTPLDLETPKPTEIILPPVSVDHSLEKCIPIEPEKSTDFIAQGYLILSGSVDENRGSEYKMNLETNETLEIEEPGEGILDIRISPDRKLMAYESLVAGTAADNLIVADSSGKRLKNIPWKEEWVYLSSWLDTNRLMILMKTEAIETTSTADQFRTFVAFNPFTKESVILQPDLEEIFIAPGFTGLRGEGFNSELDRVIYLQGDRAFIEPLHYVLWDLEGKRTLADFEVVIQPTAYPTWSVDASKFALAASIRENIYQTWPSYELYSVSRDGQVTQLTQLTDYYPWVYIEDYSWSPDGISIAFWLSWWSGERPDHDLPGGRYLAVVQTENNKVTNLCIQGKPGDNGKVHEPVWSPDGKQVVVESVSPQGNSHVILVDLAQHTAVQIGEDMTPIGWMK